MNEYLVRTANPAAYTDTEFRTVITVSTEGSDTILDILHTEDPTKAGDTLIGGWRLDGRQIDILDSEAFETIRPLGNFPPRQLFDEDGNPAGTTRGGDATDQLLYHYFFGWGQRQLGEQPPGTEEDPVPEATLYPEDNSPFAIEVRHKYFGGNANPAWDSYGWRAEFIGPAGSRDPSARAIGIYNDPECTDYWYTTGAFGEQPSEWQTDEVGDPLIVWGTEYNPGLLGSPSQTPVDVHHAVLLGSAQEGYQTLPGGDESAVSRWLYWETTQGETPGGTWQDTGSTVTGIVGAAVYNVDDDTPFQSMATGTPLRIGGEETEFDRIFSPGIIVVTVHNPNAVGEVIEAQL